MSEPQVAEPQQSPAPSPPATPPPQRQARPAQGLDLDGPVRWAGRGLRLLVACIVIGVVATSGLKIKDAVQSLDDSSPAVVTPTVAEDNPTANRPTPERPAVPERPPVGLERGSLVRRTTFARAIGTLRRRGLGRLTTLRVAPDRIDAQLLTRDGRLRSVQIGSDLALRQLSLSGPGFGHVSTMGWANVRAAAPARLTRAAARRHGVSPTRLDYLVLGAFGGAARWSIFLKGGAHDLGDVTGRIER